MAADNQGEGRGGNTRRGGGNNNRSGRDQYSGVIGTARGNPLATAAAVGGAIAAGLFLWSRRNEVSDQIGNLADQLSDWRDSVRSPGDFAADDGAAAEQTEATSGNRNGRGNRSQREIAEEALTLKQTGATA
jgi:hypothetical protein